MVNVALLQKALDFITEHPEQWHQGDWMTRTSCGTACCLAGTIALMEGYKPVWEDYMDRADTAQLSPDSYGKSVFSIAQEALNIKVGQADDLFWGSNGLATLWELAFEFSDGQIKTPSSEILEAAERKRYRIPTIT